MKTIYLLRSVALSSIFTTASFLVLFSFSGFSQSESNNPYTRDTLITQHSNRYTNSWWVRITTQQNDTTRRPALCFISGSGEVGTDVSRLTVYGGHYWLNNGWDGGVVLGNGKHYPIIITIMQPAGNQPANQLNAIMDTLIKYYPILKGSIHVAGLSEGSWCWGELIQYAAFAGDESAMSKIKSYVNLEGVGPVTNTSGFDLAYPSGLGHWAKKYGGKFLGLEGFDDPRNVWQISANMNDSAAGSAFFAYESDGGGAHCCWNDFYNPATTNLTNANPNIDWSFNPSVHPHTMGNYSAPSSIVQWMLRQGDTSLAGSAPAHTPPVVSAGDDPTIILPEDSVALGGTATDNGGTIVSYSWTEVSGPAQYTISNSAIINPTISNLVAGNYIFRLTVTDNFGLTAYSDVPVNVEPASSGTSPIPGQIESESYNSMSGVATQPTSDAGGGLNVGWIDSGDWMNYNVNVAAAGGYIVSFRIATPNTGAALQLRQADGTVLATLSIPNTGSFQTWQTISTTVTLAAGSQTLSLYSTSAAEWNINWMQFEQGAGAAIPGQIEAESYYNMSGVATQATSDAGGGLNVGWIDKGDWMDYNVNVASAGTYTVNFRIASPAAGAGFQLRQTDGTVLATLSLPATGTYQTWQTVTDTVVLPAGNQTLQIYSTSMEDWNINWMQFTSGTTTTQAAGAMANGQALSFNQNDSLALPSSFSLYPNPVKDHIIVEINNGHTGSLNVQVINLSGVILETFQASKDQPYVQLNIPCSDLPPGIYLVRAQIGSDWSIVKKWIKL
jgi:hypothetical protein